MDTLFYFYSLGKETRKTFKQDGQNACKEVVTGPRWGDIGTKNIPGTNFIFT